MSINPADPQIGSDLPAAEFPVEISANAIKKVKMYAAGNPEFQGKAFRVFIKDGGCAGFRYTFVFDDANPQDQRTSIDGVDVVIDPQSLGYLRGSTVDYVETLEGAGFTVNNPNAQKTCGCGSSFGGC